MKKNNPKANFLFEVSWEICNKVGGIFTVVESKAAHLVDRYKKNYCLVGPYFKDKISGQFQEKKPPKDFQEIFAQLKKEGINCHFGIWLIDGEPNVILVDFADFWPKKNQIKAELWQDYQIDSLESGSDFDEPVVWGWAVGRLLELAAHSAGGRKIAGHFHEWLTGSALLYLKKRKAKMATVFTTHATALGRSLAGKGIDVSAIGKFDFEKEAYGAGVHFKHQLEKTAAQQSDVFTTVSEITALEAEKILGKKPDLLLCNGFNVNNFGSFEEAIAKQKIQKNRIKKFASAYFFPYYPFNLKKAFFCYLASRYEFHNKGIDIFARALGRLNRRLAKEKSDKTFIAFFWVPAGVGSVNQDLVHAIENLRDIEDSFEEVFNDLSRDVVYSLTNRREFQKTDLFSEDFLRIIKKKLLKFKKEGKPSLSTHNLLDENDPLLAILREEGLENRQGDRVKIIFYPIYLTGDDGLLNLDYYECLRAGDLGVFPSFYEPWGYTPLESAALGVPAITSDLAGFGRFIQKQQNKERQSGIYVIKRFKNEDQKAIEELADILYKFVCYSEKERMSERIKARELAEQADWENLIEAYIEAHNKSLAK